MPTKRTKRPRGRRILTLGALSGEELLDFAAGWRPEDGRWEDYDELLAAWEQIRDEWLAGSSIRGVPFAEWLYQRYGRHVPAGALELVPGDAPAIMAQPRLLWEFWAERNAA